MVTLQAGDTLVPSDTERAAMMVILKHVLDERSWAVILTSDRRNTWAKVSNAACA